MKALPVVLLVCLLAGCSTIRQMMPAQQEAKRRAEQLQDLQLNVMRFADEYASRVSDVSQRFRGQAQKPEDRLAGQNWRLSQSEAAYQIASGPNPLTNALDLVVLASLSRMVLEDSWVGELYGDRAKPVQEAHRALEQDAWDLAAQVLTPSQMDQLRDVIARWRANNPTVRNVGAIHFAAFAKSVGSPRAGEEQKIGSLFSLVGLDPFKSLDPAIVEITQTRQLAERSIYYLQRAPGLINMQVERFTDQMAIMPETRTLLASIDRISLVGSAADTMATSLPGLLSSEREALVKQLLQGVNDQSAAIGALSSNLRSTLQAGTETADALQEALATLDRLAARFPADANAKPDPNARPFDIRDYTDTMRELTIAVREINGLAQSLDTALPVVRDASQVVTGDVEQLLDRVLQRLLVIVVVAILGTLLAALAYRFIVSRMGSRRTSQANDMQAAANHGVEQVSAMSEMVEIDKPDTATREAPADSMVWIPGGRFLMGSNDHYPEEAPVHPRERGRLLDGSSHGHQRRVPPVRRCHRLRHARGTARQCGRLSGCQAGDAGAVFGRVQEGRGAGRHEQYRTTGGRMCRGPTGDIPVARRVRCRACGNIRWCTSRSKTRRPTRNGSGKNCRRRRNGNSRRAAALKALNTPGVPSSCPKAVTWPIPGRANSRGRTCSATAMNGRPPWPRSRRMATVCTTWPATCGSGPPTGTRSTARSRSRAARSTTRAAVIPSRAMIRACRRYVFRAGS